MKHWHVVLAIGLSLAGCRYRYELLPSPAGPSGAGAAGEASLAGTAGSGDADGGATAGGAPDGAGVGGSDGNAAGGEETSGGDGGMSIAGSSSGSGGSGGSGSGIPPNMALCVQSSYGGHDYLLCQEQRNWADANGGCVAVGMHLVRVDDANENQWLFTNANLPQGSTSAVWLGATDQAVEGEWRWSDGDLFWLGDEAGTAQNGLFHSWYFREPNNVNADENCAVLETTSVKPQWYDYQCRHALPYACESP